MNLIRHSKAFALAIFCCAPIALCQTAYVRVTSPAPGLLTGAQMQLAASITDLAGTPIDASGLVWSSSNPAFATVSSSGMLQGLLPGDITVSVTDSNTTASASLLVHVVPRSINIQPPTLELAAGATAPLTAKALDVNGNPIAGVTFQFRSGQSAVADVTTDGTVKAVAEGFVTIEARIDVAANNPSLIATVPVHVLPAPLYRLKKVFSTETTGATTIAAFTTISAVSASEIAGIATLANGSQAAFRIEGGKQKLLAVTGRMLPNIGRMVMRIDGISANSKGDVALHIEYPSQWCSSSIVLIPHGQPEQEIASGLCYAPLNQRALAEDGSILYRNNDQLYKGDAVNGQRLLFSMATQPSMKDPVRSVNDFYPSRAGTFVLNSYLASGTHQYFYYDGHTLTPIYKDGDVVSLMTIINLGTVVGASDGTFYAAIYTGNGTNYSGLAQLAPGPIKVLIKTSDPVPGGTFGWIQNLADAGPGGIFLSCDLSLKNYNTWVALWNSSGLTPVAQVAGWSGLLTGAILPSGAGVGTAQLPDDTSLVVRTFTAGSDPAVVPATTQAFTDNVPGAIDWHYATRGGSTANLPVRAEGDAIFKFGDSAQALMTVGSKLPNGRMALWIGGAVSNQNGDALFSAGFYNGSGIYRYHAGALDTLVDSTTLNTGPSGISFNWVDSYRGRYLSLNNKGNAAVIASYNNARRVMFFGPSGQRQISQQNANGQVGFFSNLQTVAIDDDDHVMFIATTPDNVTAVYYWDGNSVQKVIGMGDKVSFGLAVNEISNIAGAGHGFVVLIASGNYANRQLLNFDGSHLTVIESTDTSVYDGVGISYYWYNECTLSANGDAHCMMATQDNAIGVFAHRQSGADVVVARTRDRFATGEWMIMPLAVSSSASGEVFFTALMYKDGAQFLALYQATLQ
jgi:hypothetical protein